jgi:hypothetical protein
MSISILGLIFLILGAIAQIKKPSFIIYVLVISSVLGAASAVDLAGKPILPGIFVLGFLCLYLIRVKDIDKSIVQAFRENPSVGFLLIFTIFSCVASFFLPRFFKGDVWVYNLQDGKYVEQLLIFSGSHVAQIFYMLATFLFFLTVIIMVRQIKYMIVFADALLVLGVINIVLGLSDLVFYNLGMTDYLTYLKNANYAIVDQSLSGVRRIAGSFSETSSFSRFTAGLMAFSFFLYRSGYRKKLSGAVALFSFLLVLLATSSSGYISLAFFSLILMYVEKNYLLSGQLSKGFFLILVFSFFTACMLMLLFPEQVLSIIDSAIFNKLDSASGIERSEWNASAWDNFLQTYGFGVGLGGNKASSFYLVLLSNVGWFGLVLYIIFFFSVLKGRLRQSEVTYNAVSGAAKAAVLVMLAPALFSATSAFIGTLFCLLLPLAACSKGFAGISRSFTRA